MKKKILWMNAAEISNIEQKYATKCKLHKI